MKDKITMPDGWGLYNCEGLERGINDSWWMNDEIGAPLENWVMFARAILAADRERRLGMLAEVPRDRCGACDSDQAYNCTPVGLSNFCPACGERLGEVTP